MKKLVVLLTLVATASAFSQGQVNFNTKISASGIDAPISYDGTGPVPAGRVNGSTSIAAGSLNWGGVNARAGLYGGPAGTAEGALTLITPSVPFRTTTSAAGYIDPNFGGGNSTRTINGVAIGSPGVFQVRAWDAGVAVDSYEAATARAEYYHGKSVLVNIATLGGGSVTPSVLTGLAPFSMTFVPEPSIIGLGLLGAVAGMVVFRRRR